MILHQDLFIIALIVVNVAAIVSIIFAQKKLRALVQLVLLNLITVLVFMIIGSITKPIRFDKEKKKRYNAVIENLKDIRKSQVAYKDKYGKYAASFDSLLHFIKNDSLSVVWAEGTAPDTLTEKEAVEMGLITRDTVYVSVRDTLFPENYHIDSLPYVPYTQGKEKFRMDAAEIETSSKVKVQVFEAKVPNTIILNGLDHQEIVNLNAEARKIGKYEGLKVGSLQEATNNAGNWE